MDMKDIKMRVLYSSDKAKMKTFASALGEAFKCLVDAVPLRKGTSCYYRHDT